MSFANSKVEPFSERAVPRIANADEDKQRNIDAQLQYFKDKHKNMFEVEPQSSLDLDNSLQLQTDIKASFMSPEIFIESSPHQGLSPPRWEEPSLEQSELERNQLSITAID